MDIKYFIEPIFKIEFFKIKCIKFKDKKIAIEKALNKYPEMPLIIFIVIEIKQMLQQNLDKYLKMSSV